MYALLSTLMATRYGLRSRWTPMTRGIKSSGMEQPGSYVTRGRPNRNALGVRSEKGHCLPYLKTLESHRLVHPELGQQTLVLV
jgi:hypothetical protein